MPKRILLPTPKTLSTPKMMPRKIEGENLEVHLEQMSTKVSDEATLQEEEWSYWQHQQNLAEAVAPVPEMEFEETDHLDQWSDWDSWEGQDWSEQAAPVEPADCEYPEGMVTDLEDVEMDVAEDMTDMADSESVPASDLDELHAQLAAETERLQGLELNVPPPTGLEEHELQGNLMVPTDEEGSDTEEEGQPHTLHPPTEEQGQPHTLHPPTEEEGQPHALQQPEDPLGVIEMLGISQEALLVAPATPPRKPKSTEAVAPRTPPLQPEAPSGLSQEDAKALERLCSLMGAPGTPPRDPQSPGRGPSVSHPSSPVVIPTSAVIKSEPEKEDSRFAKAKSFEELVQQSFDPAPSVNMQTDDDLGLRNALVTAVLNS